MPQGRMQMSVYRGKGRECRREETIGEVREDFFSLGKEGHRSPEAKNIDREPGKRNSEGQ